MTTRFKVRQFAGRRDQRRMERLDHQPATERGLSLALIRDRYDHDVVSS